MSFGPLRLATGGSSTPAPIDAPGAVRRLWRSKLARRSILGTLGLGAAWFTTTSSAPWVPPMAAPSAEQVTAARAAARQLVPSNSGGKAHSGTVTLTQSQLAAISALASHGLSPDRLSLSVADGLLRAEASRPFAGGRWLNLRATVAAGESDGFPPVRLSLGLLTLPASLGRYPFELARAVLWLKGVDLPPLDRIVRTVSVGHEGVSATVRWPNAGLVDQLTPSRQGAIDPSAVVASYCGLAAMQRARPQADFAAQVRRTFAGPARAASPEKNGAALVALAMLVVDARAGLIAGVAPDLVAKCRMAPTIVTLHGRSDLPKHWAMSAAIAAAQGTGLARAIGEWKELADSVADPARAAAGDPSGFSFVDLAADRAGFQTASAATAAASAKTTAAALATATAEQLLPPALLQEPDGLTDAQFKHRYGSVKAGPYAVVVAHIDQALTKRW